MAAINIPTIKRTFVDITVEGVSPLVMHKWSEKAKEQMRIKQQKQRKAAKVAKDPEENCEAATYYRADGSYGFPSVAFKAGMVRAAKQVDGLAMTDVRSSVFIRPHDDADPELVLVECPNGGPKMREDMVRVGMGTADLRYRPEFTKWRAYMTIELNENGIISPDEAAQLLNLAGFHVGIGENRPEKGGDWGRYQVVGD